MWMQNNVSFYQPRADTAENGDQEEESEWFHLFALHQNRDLGRGKKNAVHESMIPEWMDCVVW